jgi:hypothetical protein
MGFVELQGGVIGAEYSFVFHDVIVGWLFKAIDFYYSGEGEGTCLNKAELVDEIEVGVFVDVLVEINDL